MNASTILVAMAPQHLLLAGIVILLLDEIFSQRTHGAEPIALVAVAAAAAAAFGLHTSGYAAAPFPGQFSVGSGESLATFVLLLLAAPCVLLARREFSEPRYYILLLASLYGATLLPGADSFLTLFLGLEMMSVPVYALVVMAFHRPDAAEAALKYLVIGGTATATLLLGVSLLFGSTGSLDLAAFGEALRSGNPMAMAATTLVVVAFFVKSSVVPFHTWSPDAYEAASLPATAFMAVIVKAAALFAVLRILGQSPLPAAMFGLIALLPLVSMVWGNLAAMRQSSFRRMIAYSSVAHAGYLFFALLGEPDGRFQAVTLYLLVYGLLNLLAFASLPAGKDDARNDAIDGLRGLARRSPWSAAMIAIAMLSLAGIPPLPGFIAKFLIFKNVLDAGHVTLAVAGLVASYLGIYFYLRVIQLMYMGQAPATGEAVPRIDSTRAITALLCLAPAALVAIFPGWVLAQL